MNLARARGARGLAIAALLALAVVGGASASGSIRPAPGVPDPRLMVLTSADLGGAKVTAQKYYKDDDFPSVISYGREFEKGKYRGVGLPYVDSEAEIGTSAPITAKFLASLRAYLGSKQGRKAIADSITDGFPLPGLVSTPQVGRPRSLGVGPGSFDLTMSIRVIGVRTEFHLSAFSVERVLGGLVVVGTPGRRVPLGTMTQLAKIMASRMTAQLTPRSTTAPTISGTPAVGQTLTATTGTWSANPMSFSYQWQRCDAGGNACAAIPGATIQTYLVAAGDAGATLRVAVTARNSVGSATASSAQTAVVQTSGAPVSTSPPTISGTAAVGQTLIAGTGAWTGSPTSYGFQWQRCNASGASCVDVAGATGGTYVVASTDVGSTLRVVVTATNSSGTASAASAPTAAVT